LDERRFCRRARSGAVGDEALPGLGDVQDLALELKRPGLRVADVLEHRPADLHVELVPHLREKRREREHLADQALDLWIPWVAGVVGPQVGDRGPGEAHEVLVVPYDVGR